MDINVQNIKIELIQWLTTIEDDSIIQKILDLRKNETKDWYDQISQEEKESIASGISDAQNGRLKSNIEAQKIYGKWL